MKVNTRFHLVYFAAWVPFAALYGLLVAQQARPIEAVQAAVFNVGVAAVLGLAVRRVVPFIQARGRRTWQVLALHGVAGAVYAVVWTTVISLTIYFGAPEAVWREFAKGALWWQLITALSLYGLLAGAFSALQAGVRLREQERLAARAEALRVRAELKALRSQLNPHFLFNTLHSILALVRSDARAAEQALERFGVLMRRVLDIEREQSEEVPLVEELEFVRAYLALERMRLGDRLRVTEEIDPEALECHVLAFSLQPLVENAIVHGIVPLPRGGTVRLAAQLDDETLTLEVGDDGAGANADRLTSSDGVGLQAVRQRLAARFGAAARVHVAAAPGEGCRVRIVMPVVVRPLARASSEFAVPR
jgi:signal transduction histidine kinase